MAASAKEQTEIGAALVSHPQVAAVGLIGSPLSVILPMSFFPFGVYLTYIYFSTSIPRDLLAKAKAVVVFPGTIKGAFIVGGQGGKGLISRRVRGGWSAPAMFKLGGGSIGFQIGGSSTDVILSSSPPAPAPFPRGHPRPPTSRTSADSPPSSASNA